MYPDVRVSTETLDNEMKALTLKKFGNDLVSFFAKMEDYRLKIEAEKGVPFDANRYTTMLFNRVEDRVEVHHQEEFISDVRAEKRAWSKGTATSDQVIASLSTSYNNLVVIQSVTNNQCSLADSHQRSLP